MPKRALERHRLFFVGEATELAGHQATVRPGAREEAPNRFRINRAVIGAYVTVVVLQVR